MSARLDLLVVYCIIASNIPYWRMSISLADVGAAQAKAMIAAVAVAIGKNERMLTSLHLREVNAQVYRHHSLSLERIDTTTTTTAPEKATIESQKPGAPRQAGRQQFSILPFSAPSHSLRPASRGLCWEGFNVTDKIKPQAPTLNLTPAF